MKYLSFKQCWPPATSTIMKTLSATTNKTQQIMVTGYDIMEQLQAKALDLTETIRMEVSMSAKPTNHIQNTHSLSKDTQHNDFR